MAYIDLRDALGRKVARYDPQREILEIRARGVVSVFDLRQLKGLPPPAPAGSASTSPHAPRRRR